MLRGFAVVFGISILEQTHFSKEVLDRHQRLLRLTLSNDDKYRIYVSLEQVPDTFVKTLLQIEDRYFYYHLGVNPISMMRSLLSLAQNRPVGGSTLTMQLVRLRHQLYTKSFFGKLKQILWAMLYESLYSKKQILEAYLNLAPYGGNIEGIESAARIYFKKSASALNQSEILALVKIPQWPRKRLLSRSLPEDNLAVKKIILKQLSPQAGFVPEVNWPLLVQNKKDIPFKAPHFVNQVLTENPLQAQITTTLDLDLQQMIETKIEKYLDTHSVLGIKNAAALLINGITGEVLAWVGSRDFFNSEIAGQIDGVMALRSPGSTLKPFLYGLAMDQGLLGPETLVYDTPSLIGPYDPENFDRTYKGPMAASQALIQSRNVPAVTLAGQLSAKQNLYSLLRDLGVKNLRNEKYYGLSLALGSAEMSLYDLVSLYSVFHRHGKLFEPHKILEKHGHSTIDPNENFKKILSPEASVLIAQILSQNPREENQSYLKWLRHRYPVAWKTGTSFGFRDAWTIGIAGPYVLGVWLGNMDYQSNPALVGRELAAPLFFQILEGIGEKKLSGHQLWLDTFGLNLKPVEVCELSGALPTSACPRKKRSWFIPEVSPIDECAIHQRIWISKKTGRRLCPNSKDPSVPLLGVAAFAQTYEIWPSDVLKILKNVGVARLLPPPFEKNCEIAHGVVAGIEPLIVSPKLGVDYAWSLRSRAQRNVIPFKAVVESQVKKIYWFLDNQLIGEVDPSQIFFYAPRPGAYQVKLVDDQGRSTTRPLRVKALE